MINSLSLAAAMAISGCWTAPVADVQPKGEPRLIQGGIPVESVKDRATVQSVDPGARTLVLAPGQGATRTYKAGPQVQNLDRIKAGDTVRATVAEELTVYVLRGGQLSGAGGTHQTIASDARVLWVDPSYRLLILRYPDGRDETLKVPLGVKLGEMEAGDDVVIRPLELRSLQVQAR
ncbi:MAG TPA: hypothetical protein VEK10_01260 [Steroidobacteraceae bacterium]|nr:hypothetical protein [Steroidobacteraceae bacterium]